VLGAVPTLGIRLVSGAAADLAGTGGTAIPLAITSGAWAISGVVTGTFALVIVLWWIRGMIVRRQMVRRETTWACGYPATTPRMQYTASSFAAPLLGVFDRLSGVHVERGAGWLRTHPLDPILDGVALPAWHAMQRSALRLRTIQHGRLHVYLLYVMGSLIALLAYLVLGPR
jgi:hydrogenase-4 component B